ncbi:MAG TPA: helix-turn-helix domain-containing protein [Clostridia bacterium]|nr:helix-turn-helix domain-containing protein [Clostridia bacterium]
MKEVIVLHELEQIKAVSNSYRIQVIKAFGGDLATAKTIADKMGEPHAKVNYHIKELLNVGVLELVEEKVRLGIVEKFYKPSAKVFIVDRNILNGEEGCMGDSLIDSCMGIFEGVSKEFYKAIENEDDLNEETLLIKNDDYYLTKEEAGLLHEQVHRYIENFMNDRKGNEYGETRKYSISTLAFPK